VETVRKIFLLQKRTIHLKQPAQIQLLTCEHIMSGQMLIILQKLSKKWIQLSSIRHYKNLYWVPVNKMVNPTILNRCWTKYKPFHPAKLTVDEVRAGTDDKQRRYYEYKEVFGKTRQRGLRKGYIPKPRKIYEVVSSEYDPYKDPNLIFSKLFSYSVVIIVRIAMFGTKLRLLPINKKESKNKKFPKKEYLTFNLF